MTTSTVQNDRAARGKRILQHAVEHPDSIYAGHAVLAQKGDPKQVESAVLRVLGGEKNSPFGRVAAGTFDVFAAMHLVCRWHDQLTPKTRDHVQQVMTTGVLHRGNTENHWLMFYVGNLLAAETWSDMPQWWNGLTPEVMRDEAMRWLLGMIDRSARIGHHEYDSPQYHGWHVTPYIALADHAQDPHLRQQAKKMATMLIADMALEYMGGAWAGGHSREGYRENTWHDVGTSATLIYYYFGIDGAPNPMHLQPAMCPTVTAHYQPPEILTAIARDRSTPRTVRKTKAPRQIYRHVDREAHPVRKTTYVSHSFALGSTQTGLPGAPAGPIDLVSWDLTWPAQKHEGTIVCNHPYLSPRRFSAFLNEKPRVIGRSVAAPKPYLQNPDRLFGASPCEQMMQHKGALIAGYQIPKDDATPYVNLYLPRTVTYEERSGWIIGNAGAFYVALHPIGSYTWESIREDDHVDGWLIRIRGHHIGLILDTVEATDIASFDTFCNAVTQNPLDLSGWPTEGIARYKTVSKDTLEFIYNGPHSVNGAPIDYPAWPLYDAPEVEAPLGAGIITFRHNDEMHTLGFTIDPEQDMIPMRVIG